MNQLLKFVVFALAVAPWANAFPAYQPLAGLSDEQLNTILPRLQVAPPQKPPGPPNDTSAKLVNDPAHPWKPAAPNDQRGPCPGLNTLASHGVSASLYCSYFSVRADVRSISLVTVLLLQLKLSMLYRMVSRADHPNFWLVNIILRIQHGKRSRKVFDLCVVPR